jgi:hypothetical protein
MLLADITVSNKFLDALQDSNAASFADGTAQVWLTSVGCVPLIPLDIDITVSRK